MDSQSIERALVRMSHEIYERNADNWDSVVILGIPARGDRLASRLAEYLERDRGTKPALGILDITFHRDDVGEKHALPKRSSIPGSLEGKIVVLIDDVLFTGRSVRAAMDALVDYGRPRSIQLGVLVDRGHRELPIRADYVGKNVPTPPESNVRVELSEEDGRDRVVIEENG